MAVKFISKQTFGFAAISYFRVTKVECGYVWVIEYIDILDSHSNHRVKEAEINKDLDCK